MEVAWLFEPVAGGTLVRITHDFEPHWPFGDLIAEQVIGRLFVDNIAGKTLRCLKQIVEGGRP